MMTAELAEYLIGLDKYIFLDGGFSESFLIDIKYPMNFRLPLSSRSDLDQSLLVNIKESEKKSLKISIHHQDNNTQNGLLRIDFNSRHLNPVTIIPTLPEVFKAFAGQWLDGHGGHIHYVVDGYKPLSWAIPLEVDGFPVKELNNREDYINTLSAFFQKINLKTKIKYNHQIKIV